MNLKELALIILFWCGYPYICSMGKRFLHVILGVWGSHLPLLPSSAQAQAKAQLGAEIALISSNTPTPTHPDAVRSNSPSARDELKCA